MDSSQTIQMINIDNIIPNRFQPRLSFDDKGLNELASSIKEHGIIQPIVLRKIGDKYEIIAGERRYKAATIAGLTTIPAIVSNMDDNQSAEVALVENIQRRNLTSIEEAKSYKKILDKGYLNQEELAKKMGVSQSTLSNKLRLLNLSIPVQEALLNEKISERHARSLLQISDILAQENMLKRVINDRLTVRQLDTAIKEMQSFDDNAIIEESIYNNPDSFQNLVKTEIELENSTDNQFNFEQIEKEEPQIEEKNNIETLDVLSEEETISDTETINKGNRLLSIFDKPAYPSLEDEKVNLSFELSSDNIFDNDLLEEKTNLETSEPKPLIEEPQTIIKEPIMAQSRIIEKDLDSVINSYKELESEIKEGGFKIITEEFDFEDLYQIIIKIDKQAD